MFKGFWLARVLVLLFDVAGKPNCVFRRVAIAGSAGNQEDAMFLTLCFNLPLFHTFLELIELQANGFLERSREARCFVVVEVGGEVLADSLGIASRRSVEDV